MVSEPLNVVGNPVYRYILKKTLGNCRAWSQKRKILVIYFLLFSTEFK